MIKTTVKFFGQTVYMESSGIGEVDKALKTLFHDSYFNTAPLEVSRSDSQIVLAWSRGESDQFSEHLFTKRRKK